MAFIEQMPALIEPMARVPDTWRGRLPDGTPVAVLRHAGVTGDRARAAVSRLRAIAGLRHSRLLLPLGAAADAEGLAVIYPSDLGHSPDEAAEPLDPAAGLALAEDVLGGLAALHGADQAHGAMGEGSVRLLPDGAAKLWAFAPEAPGADARAADVRNTAELVCRLIGLPLEWTQFDPVRDVERSAPALAATLRALARGSLALDAEGCLAALSEAAGGLAGAASGEAGRGALRELAGGPAPAPAEPPAAQPAAPQPLAPLVPRRPRYVIPAVALVALLLLAVVGTISFKLAARPGSTGASQRPPVASSPIASPAGHSSPSLPPASAGDVHSVAESPQNECALGSTCTIQVTVYFAKTDAATPVTWQFQLVDGCTGDATYVDGNTINALKGWTHVIGNSSVSLPAGHPLSVVAVTMTPSQAASSPLLIAGGAC